MKKLLSPLALRILSREEKSIQLAFKRVICVSEATRDTLTQAGIQLSDVRIVNTGIEVQDTVDTPGHTKVEEQNNSLDLVYAGRLTREKGLETAIEAMRIIVLNREIKNLHLTIAGSGHPDYEKHLKELVNQQGLKGTVTFLGRIPYEGMADLYRRMDILLLPSIWPEPLARVILEAWSYGLVVVASDAGGNKELIQNGENGLLFPASDSETLAEIIAGLVENPQRRDAFTNAGRRIIQRKYSFSQMIDQMENYFYEILETAWRDEDFKQSVVEAASS
jgi:glycosyltransferase involved in cell wall biosynthesis